MEIKILEEKPNPLLHRHEYWFEVSHATEATPKREDVREEFAKLAHAKKERVVIERMNARYGTATTRGEAIVYETAEAAKATERAHILVRNGLKEKETKGPAAPAEAAPVAPKAESPKVEPPAPKE